MISFIQLCEFLTKNQRHSWFFFPKDLLSSLTDAELSLVFIEKDKPYHTAATLWYPKEKWFNRRLSAEGYKIQLRKLLEDGDIESALELKKRMK